MRSVMFEIKIMAKKPLSQHGNIVRLLAISWDEDEIIEEPTLEDTIRPVLVVELAWQVHPDLASLLESSSQGPDRLDIEDALSLACDIADGLAALHSFGVVHGDLKPHNILLFLDPDKTDAKCKTKYPALVAKIGDFGFSGTISAEEDVHGETQFWNAPECLPSCPDAEMRAYATKPTRDIYSYALILVHLVTNGTSPFEGLALDSTSTSIDAGKLDGRVADHCSDLIRHYRAAGLSGELVNTITDFLAEALFHIPCDRLSNVGGVRELLTGIPLPKSTTEAFTKATFFSIHIQGVPDAMEYGHTDLSSFWRGASGQIPQSRKSLLRRVIDFDYLSTLTKEERHGLLYAGHAFINAENASKGVPPVYPNTVMVHDVLQSYTNKQAQQHVDEFKELDNDRGRSVLADQGTEEMEEVLEGFAYFYKKWKFTSSIVSLKNCIEMNQVSLARVLLQYYKVSADEDLGHNFNLLHLAAMRNRPIFVPILVACGVGINQKGGNVGFTPLHEAIRAGSSETTVALLDAGADVEMYSDTFSNTAPFSPFELALECPNRSSKTVSLLLSRGAKYGHTTQSLASLETACRHPDILLTLLNHDPSLSRLETRKRTLLHAAVAANRPRSVQILLERGADVNVRDIAGRTPLAALSSINKLGSYVLNANFYVGLPVKHFDHEMWNPKSFDETQSLLIEYGGEEPDDYIYTVGERNMMIAVARYLYCLEHFGTGMLAKLSLSSLVQGLMAGKGVLDPSTMISIMAETLKDQKELAINMLASVHLLATSTQHLPVDSEVLGQKFTAKFKEYLAGWLKFVNWDEMMDLGLAIVRYAQDPVEPQTPLPEGIDDATVQEIFQEIQQASQNGKVMSFKSPESRLVLSWFLNAPVPDDIDAALNCLTSPYVPELAKGRSISEPTRLAFEQLAAAQKALKPGGEWDGIGDFASSFNNFLESIGPASITAPPTQLLPFHHTGNEDMTYQPSFLSDLSPHSLIWVCLPTESRLSRQARIFTPVALIAIFCLLLLWRVRNWIRWLTFSRVVSAILIHFIRDLIVAYPSLIPDITRFAPIIAVTGWLAKGSVWQMLLECHLTYGLFKYIFSEDSKDDLVLNQVRFRLRYGFPDAEPVIISHKSGAEWNYNFLDLYESMWGNYSLANFGIYDWVHRCDAVAALIDQWAAEEEQGLETSKKFWGRGWWFYIESENRWKKFDFLSEGTLPDRGKTMKAFEEIERMVHVKGCPELYQNFRKLFPDITTRDKYRELEELLRDHPDILYVVQGIWID